MLFRNGRIDELLISCDNDIVIFGTSNIAMALMEDFTRLKKCEKILYFVDNDRSLWGLNISVNDREYRIESPEYLEHETRDICVIVASTYVYDIAKQIGEYRVLESRDCWFYTFMKWCPNQELSDFLEKAFILRNKYYNQMGRFERLRGSHRGERCFIVGNGPSLTMEDLNILKGEYCFAANQIFFAFDKTNWRPNVYLTVNVDTFLAYHCEIDQMDCELKFIDSKALDYGIEIKDALYLKHGKFASDEEMFSNDISQYYYNGGTVVYTALQVAFYMGFNSIYLIGVDNNYTIEKSRNGKIVKNNIQNHFYKTDDDNKTANLYSTVDVGHLTQSFENAKQYAQKNGLHIYNATRGGKLEVFPRVVLEEII